MLGGIFSSFRFPSDQQRSVVIGKTGEGKTQAAAWQLSHRSIDSMPWIIFDFKREELLNEIPYRKYLELRERIPTEPGVYLIQPVPERDDEIVEATLWEIWQRGNTGIFIDEAYMIPNSAAIRAILTQGRSLHIPVIALSQRPKWISRFFLSEADFFQIFWLNDADDRKTVERFIPEDSYRRLSPFFSLWYDVGRDRLLTLEPVPERRAILERFEQRLRPKQEAQPPSIVERKPRFRFF